MLNPKLSESKGKSKVAARELALRILVRVEEDEAYADRILDSGFDGLGPRDRDLVRELVMGVLRWRLRLDWIISGFLKLKLAELRSPIRNILRMGTYEIFFLDRIPERATVHESVELAKIYGHRGTAGLVNAVLRSILRGKDNIFYPDRSEDPIGYLSIVYSHPRWMVERWLGRYGLPDTELLCQANNTRRPLFVRLNPLKVSENRFETRLGDEGLRLEKVPGVDGFFRALNPSGIFESEAFSSGWFQVQDPSAGLVTFLLDPRPGERVLDMCSAPGGKTTHIAQLMEDRGSVVALDIHPDRAAMVEDNVNRLGISIVEVETADALSYRSSPFDRVLVDVPCSGLGVLARRADLRWKASEAKIAEFPSLQRAILESGSKLAAPGGRLVYSTCTIEPEENEEVVEWFLKEHPEFELGNASRCRTGVGISGPYLRTLPHIHGWDGAFAVGFVRKR